MWRREGRPPGKGGSHGVSRGSDPRGVAVSEEAAACHGEGAHPQPRCAQRGAAAAARAEPEIVSGDTTTAEVPGLSCFLRDGDDIFHTYSAYARGTDNLGGTYSLLDLTALGRQEDWEEPKGRAPRLHGADPTFTD